MREPAATVCAAFQATAAARADDVALRTKGGEIEITWREYAEQVRRIAAGLYKLGLRRGDTIALMLSNRPEFHLLDAAAMHLGAVPFSIYRGQDEMTRETFTDDGWLRTGDIGELDEDGYLTIVDRKKELIINAAGKNMSPANIESTIKTASPLIGSVVVIGDRRPYNVALIVPDPDVVAEAVAKA